MLEKTALRNALPFVEQQQQQIFAMVEICDGQPKKEEQRNVFFCMWCTVLYFVEKDGSYDCDSFLPLTSKSPHNSLFSVPASSTQQTMTQPLWFDLFPFETFEIHEPHR